MQAYVSLWSADLLDIGRAVDLVSGSADGLHVDVFDGHNVDDLLFGPDFVAALRKRTAIPLDVHLNVDKPEHWARRFIAVGADMITVQARPCVDVERTLDVIRQAGGQPSLGIEVDETIENAARFAEHVDRFLLMGTPIGVKGTNLNPAAPARVRQLRLKLSSNHKIPIFVDGGIRPDTVSALADAGADGVIPGSFVLAAPDPVAAIERLHSLPNKIL